MKTETSTLRARDQVVRWRREQLVASGFAPALASTISENTRYDLHALIELVERGCPQQLAIRILAPIEEEAAA